MRIACIYLPSLPLQVHLRGAPHRIGAPVAVVTRTTVTTCSRAAWAAGVRPGMTVAAALELAPDLVTVAADRAAELATVRALAEALLAVTDAVDLGGDPSGTHHCLYAMVPGRTRGTTFGNRVLEVVEGQGLRGRIGIADDRFTAWVAASTNDDERVVSVPRGGSAAFLAPLPLSLLAIGAEVQHVLNAMGVRTLGEFAALPPPSVGRASPFDGDYQALARGDGGASLAPYTPEGPIVERVELGGEVGAAAAVGLVAGRIASRLVGRGRMAVALQLQVGGRTVELTLPAATADERDLSDAVGAALGDAGAATALSLEVTVEQAGEATLHAAIPTAVVAEGSVPVAEAPVFQLVPPDGVAIVPRDGHRRTRRGKQRTRDAVIAQSRLFGRG
jgi:protein ImuB